MFTIGFDETASRSDSSELLEQKAAFATAAEPEFADQLFVACLASGGTSDVRQQFAIDHRSRVEQERRVAGHALSGTSCRIGTQGCFYVKGRPHGMCLRPPFIGTELATAF